MLGVVGTSSLKTWDFMTKIELQITSKRCIASIIPPVALVDKSQA